MNDLIVDLYPTRTAWLAARRDPFAIGASEAAAALGVSPYSDPWALWELKWAQRAMNAAGIDESSERDFSALSRGNRWEPVVLAEYAAESEGTIVEPGEHFGRKGHTVTIANRAFPWLRESPDAFAIDKYGVLGHVEAKTALDRDAWTRDRGAIVDKWSDGSEELIPPHYAVQAYVQLAVTGLPWNDVCVLVPSGGWLEVRWLRLMRDEETQGQIVEALTAWRERHLIGGEPPSVDGSQACNRYLARRFKAVDERPRRVATPDEAEKLRELAALRATVKAAEERVGLLTNELVVSADGHRVALADAKGAPFGQTQSTGGRTTIDSKKLQASFPDAYAACLRTGAPSVTFATYGFDKARKS